MPDPLDIRFRPEIAEFVRSQSRAMNRSEADFVESLLLREKLRLEEREPQLTVQAPRHLVDQERHDVVRNPDETDAEYAKRAELFAALLDHARRG